MKGFVIAARSGFYKVVLEDGTERLATARGHNKIANEAAGGILTGDDIELSDDGEQPVIERVLPRRTFIERGGLDRRGKTQPLVANVDRALVVFAAQNPRSRATAIDRYLVSVEYQDLDLTLVFNKWDLRDEQAEQLVSIYRSAGYAVLTLNTLHDPEQTRAAVDAIPFSRLYICGPSGVGKTTIINTLMPSAEASAVGEVNASSGIGRHTTTTIELKRFALGRYLVDTPGLGQLVLRGLEPHNLKNFYREFLPAAQNCRYGDCLHLEEPACAVREVIGQAVAPERYESYRGLLGMLSEKPGRY